MILRLADEATAADLQTYVGRAAALDRDGAVRLQARGQVLAAYVAALPGDGLLAEGLTLGLRAMALAEPVGEEGLDVTVPLAGLLDRFARDLSTELPVPPAQVYVPWAGQAPPRSGWQQVGVVPAEVLREVATAGIAEVARATAGARMLEELRRQVWSRPVEGSEGVRAGMAFAAHALGFLAPGAASVHRSGRWTRLTTPGGHVLAR